MFAPHHCGSRPAACLQVHDLHAQLATLDRYGLPDLSTVVAEGLRKLVVFSKNAICREEPADEAADAVEAN